VDDERCPACDAHLETEDEDRTNGGIDSFDQDGRDTDPDLDAWLAARAADLEEQSWAMADQVTGEW
jgi:hypothetical protein